MIKVYVAGPLTDGETWAHVRKAVLVADHLVAAGFYPFIPHLNSFWAMITPERREYEQWFALATVWLNECDVLVRIPGRSKGSDREEQMARELGIPAVQWEPGFENGDISLVVRIHEAIRRQKDDNT